MQSNDPTTNSTSQLRSRSLTRLLYTALDLRPDERTLVSAILVHSLFEGFAVSIVLTLAHSLFLESQSIANLPWVYIAGGLTGFGANWLYSRLEHRMQMATLLKLSLVLLLVPVLAFRLVFDSVDPSIVSFAMLAWSLVMFGSIEARYWELNSVLFDVRQGKRLFGLLGLGESASKVIGFLSVPGLVHLIGPSNLLFVAAGSLGAALLLLHNMLERHKSRLHTVAGEHEASVSGKSTHHGSPLRHLDKYRRLLLAFAVCAIATYTLVEFGFLREVQSRFHHLSELAPFLGIFFGVAHVLDILFKAVVTGRFLRRFGIGPALIILPIGLMAVALVIAFQPFKIEAARSLLILFGFNMLVIEVFRGSLANSAYLLLFQPLAPRRRLDAHMAKALGDPVIIAGVGLLLLIFARPGPEMLVRLSYLLIGILALWIIVSAVVKSEYVRTVRSSLRRRLLGDGHLELDTETTRELLEGPLKGNKPGEILYAVDLLIRGECAEVDGVLQNLVLHESPVVRLHAIERIEALRPEWGSRVVTDLIRRESDATVLGRAARAAFIIDEERALSMIAPLFDDRRTDVRVGALSGALLCGELEAVISAGSRVMDWTKDNDPDMRETVARVIGEVGSSSFYRPLLPLLKDQSRIVQHAAIEAAGHVKRDQIVRALTPLLDERSVRESVSQSLVRIGEPSARMIERIWPTEKLPYKRRMLIRLLGRISCPTSVRFLIGLIGDQDRTIREEALESLQRLQWKADGETELVMSLLDSEVTDAERNRELAILFTRAYGTDGASIVEALSNELKGIRRRILLLLSCVYDRQVMDRVRDHLFLRSTQHTANALETLELTLGPTLARKVIPIFEEGSNDHGGLLLSPTALPPEEGLGHVIGDPAGGHSTWTRALAVRLSIGNPTGATTSHMQVAAEDTHPVVREAAAHVGPHRVGPEPEATSARGIPSPSLFDHTTSSASDTMLTTIERILTLKSVDIFSETEDGTLIDIATILEEVPAEAGTTIIHKGDVGACMYIIHDGRVRVHDGDQVFAEFAEGEIFGELSLLDPEPRSASVTTMTDALLLRLNQDEFYELLSDNPSISRGIIRILCQRLRRLNQELMSVAGKA